MWFILLLVLLFIVAVVLTSPWRRPVGTEGERHGERVRRATTEVEDLEAARDAKYREIRDAELDRQTGKLSDSGFGVVDGALRAEAIEILKRLDRAQRRLSKLQAAEAEQQVTDGIDLDSADDPLSSRSS